MLFADLRAAASRTHPLPGLLPLEPLRARYPSVQPMGPAVKPLPPHGRRHLEHVGCSGPWVSIGSGAWEFPARKPFPVMVLPPGEDPSRYRWPVAGQSVVLIQWGEAELADVERLTLELLRAGARLVLAVTPSGPLYCYPEAQYDVA